MSNLLRITEVAKRLGVSANTAYTMAQAGTIPAFKIAGKWRVREEALDGWLRKEAREAERAAGLEDFAESLRK